MGARSRRLAKPSSLWPSACCCCLRCGEVTTHRGSAGDFAGGITARRYGQRDGNPRAALAHGWCRIAHGRGELRFALVAWLSARARRHPIDPSRRAAALAGRVASCCCDRLQLWRWWAARCKVANCRRTARASVALSLIPAEPSPPPHRAAVAGQLPSGSTPASTIQAAQSASPPGADVARGLRGARRDAPAARGGAGANGAVDSIPSERMLPNGKGEVRCRRTPANQRPGAASPR
jgi:hypothetical protein